MRQMLFADGEPRIRESLRRILRPQRHDWEMDFMPGRAAALALMEASPFDVTACDMRVPSIDGATLLCQVRERYPQIVRIVLFGHTELSMALRMVPVAFRLLAKPSVDGMLSVSVECASYLAALLGDDSIRRTVAALGDLPALPRTYGALMRAMSDHDMTLQRVARIVEQDVGVSAKVPQLVNSAFFGVARCMTNDQCAVSYLTLRTAHRTRIATPSLATMPPTSLPMRWRSLPARARPSTTWKTTKKSSTC